MSHAQSPELGKCPSSAFFDSVLRDFVISEVPLETVTRVHLPRIEGVDYDTLRCDHCGEDGLGEDVIEPYYYSNIPLYPVSAHLDCVTRDTHRMETISRITEAAKAAMVWTGPDGELETRTARLPSDWTKFTCAIGAGHNDPEANHSVLGLRSLHGNGDDHMVCRSCLETVEGFNIKDIVVQSQARFITRGSDGTQSGYAPGTPDEFRETADSMIGVTGPSSPVLFAAAMRVRSYPAHETLRLDFGHSLVEWKP